MKDAIIFFRIWPDPPIAKSVAEMLVQQFPAKEIEIVDIWKLVKRNKMVLIINFLQLIMLYWKGILFGGMNPKAAFFRTPYLFGYVRKLTNQFCSQKERIAFTFQLQSIFDTSITGIPNFIYTDHTHLANLWYSIPGRVELYSAEWIGLEKITYSNAALVFTRSANISKSLVEQYGISPEKVKCVFAGSNTPDIKEAKRKEDSSRQIILYIGIDWERKGGPTLVEAFKRITDAHSNAILKIIGCNPKIDHPKIMILGKLTIDELPEHYKTASIYCMPSFNEPFGEVFVEAMEYGLPIIATNIGAIPDMVRDGWNGYLIEPGDVDGLALALDKLLSNPELCKMFGKNGRSHASKDYNWDAVGKKIENAIRKYLKEKST